MGRALSLSSAIRHFFASMTGFLRQTTSMYRLFGRRKTRSHLAVIILSVLLAGCFNHIMMERDAPELEKQYVLTENLVLTDLRIYLPKFGQPLKLAPFAATRPLFVKLRRGSVTSDELMEQGVITQGARVKIKKIYLSMSSIGSFRKAELRFTIPATGEQIIAYASWDDVSPKLREVH